MKILTSHQPNFLPYMGFFYKIFKSDIWVISDDVIYSKSAMNNWNKIYTAKGIEKITVPISAHHTDKLCDIMLSDPTYNIKKLAKKLETEYHKASHYKEGMELVDYMITLGNEESVKMTEFNVKLIMFILKRLDIVPKEIYYGEEDLKLVGHKDERILDMFKKVNADVYYSGLGAKVYHINELYEKNNIELRYTDYESSTYAEHDGTLVENLSVIDYIFNNGYKIPKGWKKWKQES